MPAVPTYGIESHVLAGVAGMCALLMVHQLTLTLKEPERRSHGWLFAWCAAGTLICTARILHVSTPDLHIARIANLVEISTGLLSGLFIYRFAMALARRPARPIVTWLTGLMVAAAASTELLVEAQPHLRTGWDDTCFHGFSVGPLGSLFFVHTFGVLFLVMRQIRRVTLTPNNRRLLIGGILIFVGSVVLDIVDGMFHLSLSSAFPIGVWMMAIALSRLHANVHLAARSTLLQQASRSEQTNKALDRALLKARAAAEARRHFISRMSHELRTPLHGIVGSIEMLRVSNLDEEQASWVELLDASRRRLQRMTEDVLRYADLQSQSLHLHHAPFELGQLAGTLRKVFAHRAVECGIDFSIELDESLPPLIVGDIEQIGFCLRKLVDNSFELTHQGAVRVSVDLHEGSIRYRVQDSGGGIPESELPHLFSGFLVPGTEANRDKLGLGLMTTRSLVEAMGGTITAHSELGEGTTITLMFPLRLSGVSGDEPTQRFEGTDYH